MAVIIHSDGDRELSRHDDDENGRHAYKVLESGALQVLKASAQGKDWSVLWEYAPAAWHKVQGTRFVGESSKLDGADGSAPERPSGKMYSF